METWAPPVNPLDTTKVIEFNDIPALETSLLAGDVAAVLAEPVMTNIGIIHPDPGFMRLYGRSPAGPGRC